MPSLILWERAADSRTRNQSANTPSTHRPQRKCSHPLRALLNRPLLQAYHHWLQIQFYVLSGTTQSSTSAGSRTVNSSQKEKKSAVNVTTPRLDNSDEHDLLLGATPFVLKTVRRAQLFRKRFRPSGSSPESNFLEWTSKVGSVFNGLSLLKTFNRGKPRDAAGKFIAAEPDFNASALAILAPLIHSSLVSTVTANGGDKDSVKANLFCAYGNIEAIVIDPTKLASTILKYCDAMAELKSLRCTPYERQTAHSILKKILPSLIGLDLKFNHQHQLNFNRVQAKALIQTSPRLQLTMTPQTKASRNFLGFNNLAKIPSNLKAKFSTYVFSLADGLKEKMIQRYDRDLSAEFQADAQKLTLLFNKRVIWTSNETIDKVLLSNRGMSFDEAIGV
ncbi:hypothetical protein KEM48_012999 [Puccinia striiformis f. sp. tritici PST-130]|nr:hypothetical protein KEM48_012999 [Puccinia striiformis f. sp. tritici PST-130]